jgi:hypothetical protein
MLHVDVHNGYYKLPVLLHNATPQPANVDSGPMAAPLVDPRNPLARPHCASGVIATPTWLALARLVSFSDGYSVNIHMVDLFFPGFRNAGQCLLFHLLQTFSEGGMAPVLLNTSPERCATQPE